MRKAQIKMGETIAVLIVFFILLMTGLIIYTNSKEKSIGRQREEAQDLKEIEIAMRISMLPEVQCSDYMCIGCTDAFDMIKLESMVYDSDGAEEMGFMYRDKVKYAPMFSYSKIEVDMMYPSNPGLPDEDYLIDGFVHNYDSPLVLYDNSPADSSGNRRTDVKLDSMNIPINLYNAYSDECNFGLLKVGVYET